MDVYTIILKMQNKNYWSYEKDYKVGDIVTLGRVKLKVVESDKLHSCNECFFSKYSLTCNNVGQIIGECTHGNREDKKDVIFIELD